MKIQISKKKYDDLQTMLREAHTLIHILERGTTKMVAMYEDDSIHRMEFDDMIKNITPIKRWLKKAKTRMIGYVPR